MGRLLAASLGLVAGCAQIAGIDDTNGNGRAVDSLTLTRMSIGATVETAPLDLTGLKASFLVANGAGFDRVAAVNAGGGTWTSELRVPAPVEFTLPDGPPPVLRVFAFPTHALSALHTVAEHPAPAPAPEGAMLSLLVQLDTAYVATDRFQVLTLGAWSARTLGAGEIPQAVGTGAMQIGPVTYAFASSGNPAGRAQLDALTTRDAFLILRYAGAALIGVAEATPFDQTGNDSLSATMATSAQDRMLDAKVAPATIAQRYSAVRPAVGNLAMNWSLIAAPGYRVASGLGPVLHSGAVAMGDPGVAVAYGNPFAARGWNTMFTLSTTENRTFTPTGTTAQATLFAGMSQFIEPSASDRIDLEAGLPVTIRIDGTLLATDGQIIPPRTGFATVAFDADKSSNTLYTLQVFDLVANMAGTVLENHTVFAAVSNVATFSVPAELFQVGHHYSLRALSTRGGFPGIDAGDLTIRALPMSQSFVDSAVFTIMPEAP